MRKTKKFASILLALILVVALAAPAFAANTNTITIKNAQAGETYKIYKMLDLSVNDGMTAYSYTVNSDWNAFFTNPGAGARYVTISNGYVTWNKDMASAENMEAFGKAAAAYAANQTAVDIQTPTDNGDIVFRELESGYYLVTSTNGTLAMVLTTPTATSATVDEKNSDATIDKQVQEDSTKTWGKENSAQIGDTVNFQVQINVQKGAKRYVLHDQMDDGLTFNSDSVQIAGLTKGTDYTVQTDTDDDCTFEIVFMQSYLDEIDEKTELIVTYSAVLNENADLISGEKNQATLNWGNNSSVTVETTTKTYQFEVLKYDASDSNEAPLAGATFQLKDANGKVVKLIKVSDTEYRVANGNEGGAVESFVTVAAGNIVIKGVDLDEYSLVEIEAPEGYNKLSEPVKVTVGAENNVVIRVGNQSGSTLPTTGGIGTTIFYVIGSVLVLGAVVVMVTKKRMSTEK